VFAGPFGLRAAEAVSGDAGPAARAGEGLADQVIETLGSLVDSSLIRPVTRDGEPRFGLLEIIRGYALERLRDAGDWKQAHDRHAAYFMALAEPAESELQGPGQLRGWAGWKRSTTTCGPRCPGWWTAVSSSRRCAWPG
jgi:predicted ATPase